MRLWSARAVLIWNIAWLAIAATLFAARVTALAVVVLFAALLSTTLMVVFMRRGKRRRDFLAARFPDALGWFPVMVARATAQVAAIPTPPEDVVGVRVTLVIRRGGLAIVDDAQPVVLVDLGWPALVGANAGPDFDDKGPVERIDLHLADGRDLVLYSAPDSPLHYQEAVLAAAPEAWARTTGEPSPWEQAELAAGTAAGPEET